MFTHIHTEYYSMYTHTCSTHSDLYINILFIISNCLIYEWDIATGMFTRSLTGHSRPLTCIGVSYINHGLTSPRHTAFSCVYLQLQITQNKLVSASEDHTVCIWYYKKKKYMSKVLFICHNYIYDYSLFLLV